MEQIDFKDFRDVVNAKFDEICQDEKKVFVVDIDKDEMFNTYLDSFPVEVNGIFRERRHYDCQCCKSFIGRLGNLVKIENNQIVDTIWNVQVDGYYQEVANKLDEYIRSKHPKTKFLIQENKIGNEENVDGHNDKIIWRHFVAYPKSVFVVKNNINDIRGTFDTTVSVFKRALEELNLSSAEIVLDLIESNQLYRGNEYKHFVKFFIDRKKEYDKLSTAKEKRCYLLESANKYDSVLCRLRNTAIGTLLIDLSDGEDLEKAVMSFESKVDSTNYRRTTAVVTPKMIEQAKQTIVDLGYESSLNRKVMTVNELSTENVLWRGDVGKSFDVFQDISNEQQERKFKEKNKLKGGKKVSINEFIETILPKTKTMSVLFDSKLKNHLFTMTNSVDKDSKNLFKWDNDVSWSYNGDVTDRIKERVKTAGGDVDGDFRVSLSWSNSDDLDLHCKRNDGRHLYYSSKRGIDGLFLDLDMNGLDKHDSVAPVENIICKDKKNLKVGSYKFYVNQYNKRNQNSNGFTIQVEFDGVIRNFTYEQGLNSGTNFECFVIDFDGTNFTINRINEKFTSTSDVLTSEIWGLKTNSFVDVTNVMLSPNYWTNNVGNKHYMFVVDKCYNNESVRTIYSEYLNTELYEHRRTFELLGGKLKADPVENQVSGFGFSDTSKSEFIVRVVDNNNRTELYTVQV